MYVYVYVYVVSIEGFRVLGLGFRVLGLGIRVQVQGSGFSV